MAGWTEALSRHEGSVGELVTDAGLVDEIRALEGLACAARAAQAVLAARFDASQRRAQAAAGLTPEQRGRGVAEQLALARRESPHRGRQHLGLARVLTREMPHTLAAFRTGLITEWRATLVARETACLSLADRQAVDREVAADPAALASLGDRQVVVACQRLAARLDPASVVARRRSAEADRRVRLRPAPDTMSQLSALLPVAQGVAVHAALTRSADSLRARGDARSRGQIMADTLVERVTGQATAPGVPVRVNLVITDRSLLAGADDPAHLVADGLAPEPAPAQLGRELVLESLAVGLTGRARTQLRRLYADPTSGELVALESRSRLFPRGLADLITLRDQTCRTPWCDAPIRHTDHVVAHTDGGATSVANGQGLCESCNQAKQAPGWSARPRPGPGHAVETTTPTDHRYHSTAPPAVPDGRRRGGGRARHSRLEARFADLVLVA